MIGAEEVVKRDGSADWHEGKKGIENMEALRKLVSA